nr:C-type lectin domain-containing protein [Cowpox virus]
MDTFKKEYQDSKYVLTIGINNICHYFSDDTTTNWTASSEYCKNIRAFSMYY